MTDLAIVVTGLLNHRFSRLIQQLKRLDISVFSTGVQV
jgi:hypothetical protein